MILTITRTARRVPSMIAKWRVFARYELKVTNDQGLTIYQGDLKHLCSFGLMVSRTPDTLKIGFQVGTDDGSDCVMLAKGSPHPIVKIVLLA